jgi:hypothetical protein
LLENKFGKTEIQNWMFGANNGIMSLPKRFVSHFEFGSRKMVGKCPNPMDK